MKNLNFFDVLAILFCWVGAATIAYFIEDGAVAIVCVAAVYYLSKWIILKGQSEPSEPSDKAK
jgi:hypothetical protein